ncbi:MAG TPA: DegT/DnrJ/EryC1/StrS family aminotransferase [Candidatus Olsenella pullicola]|nr:DegT/DnrJ/EryC1/StrS family aminotransferase [Candidatus Olsenella pullicola]
MPSELPVTRAALPPLDEYVDEIRGLWGTQWITNMGERHEELERALESYLGVSHVSLFVNGHSALECALDALELSGEVITTPLTFASTVHAIVRRGLTPVLADVRPDDCTIDPEAIEAAITPRTSAIVPVHVYGNLCDVDAIADIARRHGLRVVYDAAHAFGVERGGVSAASCGDVSMLSFHATKVFNTIEGGALCYGDAAFGERVRLLRDFGIRDSEHVDLVGGNAKMNEFCAAMGLCNLRHVDGEISARGAAAARYRERLEGVSGLTLIAPRPGVRPNHGYFPVFFEDSFGASRDEVFSALERRHILCRKYFYPLVSDYACYRGRYSSADTPVARDRAARVLTLPLYGALSRDDVDRVCDAVLGCRG